MGYFGELKAYLQKPTTPPLGEQSLADPFLWPSRYGTWPYNPDIFVQRKGGLRIYEEMRRDPVIRACQWLKRLAVLCSGWNMEPASEEEGADREAADFVKEVLVELKGTLEEMVKQILTGMEYGFSVSEKIYQILADGDFKGKWGYRAIKTRKPHSWDFKTDEFGNLERNGLWQQQGRLKHPVDKFVVYSHNKEFQNWYGQSDLQAIYPHWFSKDILLKAWNMFLERYGLGLPFLHPKENKANIPEPTFTQLKNILMNLQLGSCVAVQDSSAEIEILESKRKASDVFGPAVNYHDRSMARGLLMPTGLGFAEDEKGSGGSLARSRKHFDMWVIMIMDLRNTVQETIMQEQVVRPLVDFNYTVRKYPQFKFNPLEDEETEALAKLFLEAITGKAIHPTAEDENCFRKMIGFPERDRKELQDEWDIDNEAREEARKAKIDGLKQTGPPPGLQPEPPVGEKSKVIPFPGQARAHTSPHRKLTPYEKRVDFEHVEKALDGLEEQARDSLLKVLEKHKKKVMAVAERKLEGDKLSMKWIDGLQLAKFGRKDFATEIQGIVRDLLRTGFDAGREDVRTEVQRAVGQREMVAYAVPKMPPRDIIRYLNQKSFWIKNVMLDSLTKDIKQLLVNALETGEQLGETLQKIGQAYDPYIGTPSAIADPEQVQPYRIETLIRTNLTDSYNSGRYNAITDPDLEDHVIGMQISAILDSRTTDICRRADNTIIRKDDPLVHRLKPSLHFNCRSIFIPVMAFDEDVSFTAQKDLHGILSLAPAGFGGNVDR
jgi:SPP1 gp7 family putative phage head morphogenesis protein